MRGMTLDRSTARGRAIDAQPKPPRDVGATKVHARKAPSPVIGSLIDLPGHAAVGIKIVFASIISVHPPAQV